jgi:hypothetical protein
LLLYHNLVLAIEVQREKHLCTIGYGTQQDALCMIDIPKSKRTLVLKAIEGWWLSKEAAATAGQAVAAGAHG